MSFEFLFYTYVSVLLQVFGCSLFFSEDFVLFCFLSPCIYLLVIKEPQGLPPLVFYVPSPLLTFNKYSASRTNWSLYQSQIWTQHQGDHSYILKGICPTEVFFDAPTQKGVCEGGNILVYDIKWWLL